LAVAPHARQRQYRILICPSMIVERTAMRWPQCQRTASIDSCGAMPCRGSWAMVGNAPRSPWLAGAALQRWKCRLSASARASTGPGDRKKPINVRPSAAQTGQRHARNCRSSSMTIASACIGRSQCRGVEPGSK
jgi:hypothetical protein